jgi:hypothetical protein
MLQLFASYPEAVKRRLEAVETLHNDDEEDEFWNADDYDSDDFDVDDSDEALGEELESGAVGENSQDYLKFLGDEAKRLASEADGHSLTGHAQEEEEMEEDVLFVTPIDSIDPHLAAKHFFQQLHEQDLPMYEEFTTAWGPEERNMFQGVLAAATEKEAINAAAQVNSNSQQEAT